MAKDTMANNSQTVRIHGTRYRKIPGFTNYGISANGEVLNLVTRLEIGVKDYDHWSGRVNLYRTNNSGKSVRKTFNILDLLRMTYSKAWVASIENMRMEELATC